MKNIRLILTKQLDSIDIMNTTYTYINGAQVMHGQAHIIKWKTKDLHQIFLIKREIYRIIYNEVDAF